MPFQQRENDGNRVRNFKSLMIGHDKENVSPGGEHVVVQGNIIPIDKCSILLYKIRI